MKVRPIAPSRRVEQLDDLDDARVELPHERDGWLIHYPEGRFIEHYLAGEICVAVIQREHGVRRKSHQHGFVIQALPIRAPTRHTEVAKAGNYWPSIDQAFVLPHDIELMEGIKQSVPSLVRFETFDFGDLALGKPLFFFDALYGEQKIPSQFVDGKVRFRTRLYAVALGEGGSEQIQGASRRVNDRADIRNHDRVKRKRLIGDNELFASLRIWLYGQFIRASVVPFRESFLKNWDLGAGPVG